MRIVFNSLAALKTKTSVGHYAQRLSDELARIVPDGRFVTFPTGLFAKRSAGSDLRRIDFPAKGQTAFADGCVVAPEDSARAAIGRRFDAFADPVRFDIYHEPNFLPLPCRIPTIITVHDLSVILHPEWHPLDRVRRHEQAFRANVQNAAHIITVSESVRRDVIAHLHVAADRVTAVHNGVGPEFFSPRPTRLSLPQRFLLYVGTIEPRKNLLTLLRAYCDLPSQLRERCPLVLAGGWGWKADDVADYFRNTASHRNVVHLGYVADADRPGLYSAARALVFPSHYEGFGLPPLEMLAAGGAVLASKMPAHREVLADRAAFLDPKDLVGWREALRRAICDDDWLAELRRGGRERAAYFTWDRCASETLAVYHRSLGLYRNAA